MREIDTRGLSCPQPVLMFHQAAKEDSSSPMVVLIDNEASVENVTRAAKKGGWNVSASVDGDVTRLELSKG